MEMERRMNEVTVRPAVPDDAARIAEIYNHYVLNSTVTFDTDPKSVEDRRAWIAERSPAHPVVVLEDEGGTVVAWGALSPHSDRHAWRHTVEIATYVAHDHTGRGLGPRVLADLIARARESGHHVIVSRIVAGNEASLKSVERAGFERVGVMREVGCKFGRWLDVVIQQLVLDGNVNGDAR